jgi:hypothetical protein
MKASPLLTKILGRLPRMWVFGVIAGLSALSFLVALLATFDSARWAIAFELAFAGLGASILWFLACVLIFFLELITGAVTPWRSDA